MSKHQDYAVSAKQILSVWAPRKISHQTAREDLVKSRDLAAARMINHVDFIATQEEAMLAREEEEEALARMQSLLGAFRDHDQITGWLGQYAIMPKPMRFRTLLLNGISGSGKSQKGVSLFGFKNTLTVNCQGLGVNLPSLRLYVKGIHLCILFDEINEQQVLANKLLFQSGPWRITLGQSACNQHAYTKHFHGVALICCSNTFKMPPHPDLTPEDADWLDKNVVQASPPSGCKWHFGSDSCSEDESALCHSL